MASRKRHAHSGYRSRDLAFSEPFEGSRNRRLTLAGPVIKIRTYLPLSVARRAGRKIYTYPRPLQRRRRSKVIRYNLRHSRDMVPVVVRVRLPARLPSSLPSYTSLSRNRLNIHSRKQLGAVMARGEKNRRRYAEGKGNRRKARNGQLDSPGSTAFGSVSHAYSQGRSISQIADAALAARAVYKGR